MLSSLFVRSSFALLFIVPFVAVHAADVDLPPVSEFLIEQDYPHRVIRWEWSRGGVVSESGELSGTTRVKYWKLQSKDDERYLEALGLRAPADAMPPVSSR